MVTKRVKKKRGIDYISSVSDLQLYCKLRMQKMKSRERVDTEVWMGSGWSTCFQFLQPQLSFHAPLLLFLLLLLPLSVSPITKWVEQRQTKTSSHLTNLSNAYTCLLTDYRHNYIQLGPRSNRLITYVYMSVPTFTINTIQSNTTFLSIFPCF